MPLSPLYNTSRRQAFISGRMYSTQREPLIFCSKSGNKMGVKRTISMAQYIKQQLK